MVRDPYAWWCGREEPQGFFLSRFGAQTNFSDKMKKITNILLIISGLILSPWAIYQWSLIGFQIEPKFYAGNRDGSFFLILTLIGICIISYGLWNLIVLQKKTNSSKTI